MIDRTICIDANVVIGIVTAGTAPSKFTDRWTEWRSSNLLIVAPTLLSYEITNAFYRAAIAGQISPEQSERLLQNAFSLEITLQGDSELNQRALILARQYTLPAAYDAHYLALAERLNAELWTCDRRLYNPVHPTFPQIYLLE